MWRINAVRYYELLLAFLVFIEIIVILAFGGMMLTSGSNLFQASFILQFLRLAVLITAIIILNLLAYILIFQIISNRGDRVYQQKYHQWMKLWTQSYFTGNLPDPILINPAVVNAHLDFTKTIPDDAQLITWAKDYYLLEFWQKQVHSRNKIHVLRALEAIGVLGDEDDIELLINHTQSDNLEILIASTTAFAYLIKRLPDDISKEALYLLAYVLSQKPLPVFVIEEVYSLLGSRSQEMKAYLLSKESLHDNLLIATINSIGSNYEVSFTETVAHHIHHKNPIIKQAILKLFMKLNHIPQVMFSEVLQASLDDDNGVREQALHTLTNTPLYQTRLLLWLALGNDNWWVRFAAARILKQYGTEGERVLGTASQKHDNPQGKAIAAQVLESNI